MMLVKKLYHWFSNHQRDFPWRDSLPRVPYRVWLAEIILQQTTTTVGASAYPRFLEEWPTLEHLASAQRQDILKKWAGLGYYRRAHNLYETAQILKNQYNGIFPHERSKLLALPGIGAYTAAAIEAIAFNIPAPTLDGKIIRLLARIFFIPLEEKKKLSNICVSILKSGKSMGLHCSFLVEALMDLASCVCKARKPLCENCPITSSCLAYKKGLSAKYPPVPKRKKRPDRHAFAFWTKREDGHILLRRRPSQGLLANMSEIPSSLGRESFPIKKFSSEDEPTNQPIKAIWTKHKTSIKHTFTHFYLTMHIYKNLNKISQSMPPPISCQWVSPKKIHLYPLPSLMRKVVACMLEVV